MTTCELTTAEADVIYGMLTQRFYLRPDDPERDAVRSSRDKVYPLTTAAAELRQAAAELNVDVDVTSKAPIASAYEYDRVRAGSTLSFAFGCEPDESAGAAEQNCLACAEGAGRHAIDCPHADSVDVRVVFDVESDEVRALGTYAGDDSDDYGGATRYVDADGRRLWAPSDCVRVVRVRVIR